MSNRTYTPLDTDKLNALEAISEAIQSLPCAADIVNLNENLPRVASALERMTDSHSTELKLPGGGIMTIRAQAGEEEDSAMVDLQAAADKVEETGKVDNSKMPKQPFDRAQRLRILAQAVEGMSYLDWKKARHQIDRMFEQPATLASNKTTIDKTLEEIADTIKNERM